MRRVPLRRLSAWQLGCSGETPPAAGRGSRTGGAFGVVQNTWLAAINSSGAGAGHEGVELGLHRLRPATTMAQARASIDILRHNVRFAFNLTSSGN